MAKIFQSGFDLGFAATAGLPSGWSLAALSGAMVTNDRWAERATGTPVGLAYRGTLTFTSPAISGIRGSFMYGSSFSASVDLISFGAVVLRRSASTTLQIVNNASVIQTLTITAPTEGAYVPITFTIDLSTGGAGTATFVFNGSTITVSGITTTGATATSLAITGGAYGSIDDLCVNDSTTGTDNGIPPICRIVPATLTAAGGNDSIPVSGLRSVKITTNELAGSSQQTNPKYTFDSSVGFVGLPNIMVANQSDGNNYFLGVRLRKTSLLNAKSYTDVSATPTKLSSPAIRRIKGDTSGLVMLSQSAYVTILNYLTGAASVVDASSSAVFSEVVRANNYLFGSFSSNTSFHRADLNGTIVNTVHAGFNSNNSFPVLVHYSSAADKVFHNMGSIANSFGVVNGTGTPANTNITATTYTSANTTQAGFVENSAANLLYYFGNNNVYVINTSTNAFVKQVALGQTLSNRVLERLDGVALTTLQEDFTNNKIYFTTTTGALYSYNTSTDAVVSVSSVTVNAGLAPVLSKIGTKLLLFGYDRVVTISTSTGTVTNTVTYPNPAVTATSWNIHTDGTYYFVPQEASVIFYDPAINSFEVASSKTATADNFMHAINSVGTQVQVAALQGNNTTAAQQSFTISLPVTPTAVRGVNVCAPNSNRSGALSASLQLGLKIGGTDYQAGSNITPPTSPNANLGSTLFYKTGTTEITPAELASAEVYAKIV
jgi:hypothetical protein